MQMEQPKPNWHKASYSQGSDSCVEVATENAPSGGVDVRDTKLNGEGPTLEFGRGAWHAFLRGARS